MRITFANLYWNPAWTSASDIAHLRFGDRAHAPLARALADRKHAVTIVQDAPFDAEFIDPHQPDVRWVLVQPGRITKAARTVAARLGRPFPAAHAKATRFSLAVATQAAEVVHAFDFGAYPTVSALGTDTKAAKIPLVLHFHGGGPPRTPPGKAAAREALALVSAALFTTRSHAQPFVAAGVLDASCVHEVNELSTDFAFAPETRPGLQGRPVVVSTGRLDTVKDPLTTIAGFAQFRRTVPGAHLHLAYATDTLLPAVRKLLATLGLGASVTLHGKLDLAGVESLLGRAHLFVQSSTREVCGTAVLEALAAGCPPVVTDIPAFRALLGPGMARQLFAVGDPTALAAALSNAWSLASRAAARTRFDTTLAWPVLAARIEQVYLHSVAHPID